MKALRDLLWFCRLTTPPRFSAGTAVTCLMTPLLLSSCGPYTSSPCTWPAMSMLSMFPTFLHTPPSWPTPSPLCGPPPPVSSAPSVMLPCLLLLPSYSPGCHPLLRTGPSLWTFYITSNLSTTHNLLSYGPVFSFCLFFSGSYSFFWFSLV